MFIEILFKILLFKGGVLIYAERCICVLFFVRKVRANIYKCTDRGMNNHDVSRWA